MIDVLVDRTVAIDTTCVCLHNCRCSVLQAELVVALDGHGRVLNWWHDASLNHHSFKHFEVETIVIFEPKPVKLELAKRWLKDQKRVFVKSEGSHLHL